MMMYECTCCSLELALTPPPKKFSDTPQDGRSSEGHVLPEQLTEAVTGQMLTFLPPPLDPGSSPTDGVVMLFLY